MCVEAAKLAPRQSHELATVYERKRQKGNGNRATLAVARKMVAYLLAVDECHELVSLLTAETGEKGCYFRLAATRFIATEQNLLFRGMLDE